MSVSDETLVAYVDGELDAASVREVEAVLARDPKALARAEAMRDSGALLRAAMNAAVHESPPDRLERGLQAISRVAQPSAAPPPSPAAQPAAQGAWSPRAVGGMALAASVAFAVAGLSGGYLLGHTASEVSTLPRLASLEDQDRERRDAALQGALEFEVSGSHAAWANPDASHHGEITPVRTFKNRQGLFCREFREIMVIDHVTHTTYGVACRQPEAGWRETFRLIPTDEDDQGI